MNTVDNSLKLAVAQVTCVHRDDGSFILSNSSPLGSVARCIGDWLEYWSEKAPDAVFLAERGADDLWTKLTYRQVRDKVGMLSQGLLDLGIGPTSPVVALSDAGIDQALLMLATLHIGRPFSTVSSAYSRLATDYTKVSNILRDLNPAAVYASDGDVYCAAIAASRLSCPIILSGNADRISDGLSLGELARTAETPAVMSQFAKIEPQTHAKYLLTSGSTGQPKIVVNTHGMLCANQKQIQLAWPFLNEEKPVLVSWLPWSHTFGTNYNFNMVLCNGGSYYFDEGRPLPGLIEKSARNLRDVQPNLFLNVPKAFDCLLALLEQDEELARDCFRHLRAAFYAGAALPQSTWDRFNLLVQNITGERVLVSSSLGSTETSPVATYVHWMSDEPRCVGLPVAGTAIKFLPNGEKFELRIKGPQVFTAYLNNPEQTAQAFDEEGYYKLGDAGLLIDELHPEKGIAFNGRVAEDFKLTTGTWVSVGTLRIKAISALAPYAQDVVVTGHDKNEIGLLIFPTPEAKGLSAERLRIYVRAALRKLKMEGQGGSSKSPTRALMLDSPPSVETGELTDKGYINQRAALTQREKDVQRLYSESLDDGVIIID